MGGIPEGQWLRADQFQNQAMEGSLEKSLINTPETILASMEFDEVDKEGEVLKMEQKFTTDLSEGVGVHAEEESGTCMGETEENSGVGNLVDGDASLEDIMPDNVSNRWVIDSCLEFYPKMGVTCEGEANKMEMILKDIENARN
jgi:hypothetical protein